MLSLSTSTCMISSLAMQPRPRLDGCLPTHELGCCRSLLFATAAPACDCHRHKPRCSSRAGTTLGQNPTGPRAPVSSASSSQNPGAGQTPKPQPSLCHNCCADKDTHFVAGPPRNWQGEVQEWASCPGLPGCVGWWSAARNNPTLLLAADVNSAPCWLTSLCRTAPCSLPARADHHPAAFL